MTLSRRSSLRVLVQMAKLRLELMVFTEVDAGKDEAAHNVECVIFVQCAGRGQQAPLPKHTNNDSWCFLDSYPSFAELN